MCAALQVQRLLAALEPFGQGEGLQLLRRVARLRELAGQLQPLQAMTTSGEAEEERLRQVQELSAAAAALLPDLLLQRLPPRCLSSCCATACSLTLMLLPSETEPAQ